MSDSILHDDTEQKDIQLRKLNDQFDELFQNYKNQMKYYSSSFDKSRGVICKEYLAKIRQLALQIRHRIDNSIYFKFNEI